MAVVGKKDKLLEATADTTLSRAYQSVVRICATGNAATTIFGKSLLGKLRASRWLLQAEKADRDLMRIQVENRNTKICNSYISRQN